MKSIYLPAVEAVNFEDVENFLSWLASQPGGRISMAKLQRSAQVQSVKLGMILRLVEQFSFVLKEPDAMTLTPSGAKFSRGDRGARELMFKNQLLVSWPMRELLDRMDRAGLARLTKAEVLDVLRYKSAIEVSDRMATGIMAWGHCCKLFHFDEVAQEISRIVVRHPVPTVNDAESLPRGA